jgi:hypothetical protein
MQNSDHETPQVSKSCAVFKLEGGGSKTKQSRLKSLAPPFSLARAEKDNRSVKVIFSSQKSKFADYTIWKGIQNRTGIEKEHAVVFLVKEILDNALDCLETMHNNAHPIAEPSFTEFFRTAKFTIYGSCKK